MVVDTTKSCKPSLLCDIPLVRGDCGGCVDIPLSEEVMWSCDFEPYPSIVRLILFG